MFDCAFYYCFRRNSRTIIYFDKSTNVLAPLEALISIAFRGVLLVSLLASVICIPSQAFVMVFETLEIRGFSSQLSISLGIVSHILLWFHIRGPGCAREADLPWAVIAPISLH